MFLWRLPPPLNQNWPCRPGRVCRALYRLCWSSLVPVGYLDECRRRDGPGFQRLGLSAGRPLSTPPPRMPAERVYDSDQNAALRGAVREFFKPVVGAHFLASPRWRAVGAQHRKLLNPMLRWRAS